MVFTTQLSGKLAEILRKLKEEKCMNLTAFVRKAIWEKLERDKLLEK